MDSGCRRAHTGRVDGQESFPEQTWLRLAHNLEQMEALLAEAPAEIEQRRAAGEDYEWLVEAATELGTQLDGLRRLGVEHRIGLALEKSGDHMIEDLCEATGLDTDQLAPAIQHLLDEHIIRRI